MKIQKKIKYAVNISILLAMLAVPVFVFAQSGYGLSEVTEFSGTARGNDLVYTISIIINALLILAGLVAAIYLVIGGISYITSRGEEDKAANAKNTILYAIIGLIVIGLSGVIVNFIVDAIRQAS